MLKILLILILLIVPCGIVGGFFGYAFGFFGVFPALVFGIVWGMFIAPRLVNTLEDL